MKRYPKYKDSGIEWIGEIPEHWETTRIKYLSDGSNESFIDGDWVELPYITEDGIRLIQTGNIGVGEYKEQGFKYISEESFTELDCTEVFPDDILICRLASPVGRACLAPNLENRMITSVDVCILKASSNYDPRFIVYQLSSLYYLKYIESISRGGTRARISRTMLGDISFVTTNYSEQKQIANYLDQKTKKIDSLIEKKQKLIELLKEQRTAIINQAVTKGLDPKAPMKDSGIEWLGEIPEHWEVKKIKYLLKPQKGALKTGPFGSQLKNSELDENGTIKIYNQRNILEKNFDSGNDYINETKFKELKDFEIHENDIIITSRGTIGKCAIFPSGKQKGVLHPCLIRMQINQKIALNEWVTTYINESSYFNENVLLNSNATTIDVIYGNTLREVIIPTPPIDEQSIILDYIFKIIDNIGKSIKNNEQIIENLKEYRTTLISEVVTGKIDVREDVNGSSNEDAEIFGQSVSH